MEEDIFKTLFVYPVAKYSLKPEALQVVDEWYCQAILDKLDQVEPLPEDTTMMALFERVPFCYCH